MDTSRVDRSTEPKSFAKKLMSCLFLASVAVLDGPKTLNPISHSANDTTEYQSFLSQVKPDQCKDTHSYSYEDELSSAKFPGRHGLNDNEARDLAEWLGPQAYKLDPKFHIHVIELFAGHGMLQENGLHR